MSARRNRSESGRSQGPPGPIHPGPTPFPWRSRASPSPSSRGPTGPTLRANPFPEVTDPFCRLPLPTFSHQLEAVHLGDLLRFSVRLGAKSIPSPRFSRAVEGTPDSVEAPSSARRLTLAPDNPISGSLGGQEEKKTLPGTPAGVSWFRCVAAQGPRPSSGMLTGFPFDRRGDGSPL